MLFKTLGKKRIKARIYEYIQKWSYTTACSRPLLQYK